MASLPPVRPVEEFQKVYVGPAEDLFKAGQSFIKTPDGLVWVKAPVGAITADLPPDARSVGLQEVKHCDCGDVYFRKAPQGCMVVEAPGKK